MALLTFSYLSELTMLCGKYSLQYNIVHWYLLAPAACTCLCFVKPSQDRISLFSSATPFSPDFCKLDPTLVFSINYHFMQRSSNVITSRDPFVLVFFSSVILLCTEFSHIVDFSLMVSLSVHSIRASNLQGKKMGKWEEPPSLLLQADALPAGPGRQLV